MHEITIDIVNYTEKREDNFRFRHDGNEMQVCNAWDNFIVMLKKQYPKTDDVEVFGGIRKIHTF